MKAKEGLFVPFAVLNFALLGAIGCGQSSAYDSRSADASAPREMAKTPVAELHGASLAKTVSSGRSRIPGVAASNGIATGLGAAPASLTLAMHRSVIRNADLSIRVKEIEPSEHRIDQLVSAEGGYVDSAASTDLASDHPQLKLTLRVPASEFELSIAKMEALGTRLAKTVGSEDVTGQLVDLDARLQSLTAEEATYQQLLRHTQDLGTAMQLRDKLTELRSQIETIAGQRKTTGELAALSTISVTLTQDAVPAAPSADKGWLQQTWGEASSTAVFAGRAVAGLMIWAVALIPFWLPILLFVRWLQTRSTSIRPQPTRPPAPL